MSNYAPTRGTDLPSAYAAASDRLTGRCATRRKIANNTYLERRGEDIAIRLHSTDVVTFHPDGTLTLDTGGWLTMTTKARMCDALSPLGYTLTSNRGRWTLHKFGHRDSEDRWVPSDWPAVPYADGMTLDPATGRVAGVPDDTAVKAEDTENTRRRKLIETYLRKTTPEQIVAAFENPGGDCWLCAGMDPTDPDHLLSHLDEHYVMLTLTANAVRERGYRDPDFILGWIYHDAQRGKVSDFYRDNLRKFFRKHTAVGARATR